MAMTKKEIAQLNRNTKSVQELTLQFERIRDKKS